jgi:hypothetical protein
MISIQKPTWTEMKASLTGKGLLCQYEENPGSYYIYAADGSFLYSYTLPKVDPASADQVDFEANFKPTSNARSTQLDSDGAHMSRIKVAPSGWNFQLRGVEFDTSTLDSVYNRDANDVALTDTTLNMYDAAGALITEQSVADTDCVKTVIDIEPPYDIYIAGGKIKFVTTPTENVRIAVIGVPDVPAAYGGNKHFVQNINLKFIAAVDGVNADGRAAKWLQYSATYHTNKIRFIVHHPAGHKMSIEIILEVYKQ